MVRFFTFGAALYSGQDHLEDFSVTAWVKMRLKQALPACLRRIYVQYI